MNLEKRRRGRSPLAPVCCPSARASGHPICHVVGVTELNQVSTRSEGGTRVFDFTHLVASTKVRDGRALCRAAQRIAIAPTGEIDVTYDFEWLETLHWQSFMLLLLFERASTEGCEYLAATDIRTVAGVLDAGPRQGGSRRIRHEAFTQLTIRPAVGPVHIVWPVRSECSFHWGTDIQLQVMPTNMPRRLPIRKGRRERISYRILLPVSQQ